MGKYPKAKVVPFSSVVGSSVTLHDPETERVIGQLAILNVGGDTPEDWKARSVAFADDTAKRINAHDDLVAALTLIRFNWSGHAGLCAVNRRGNCDCDWPAIAKQCDEAIAKAKGGAS